jgi:hypothetical protein
MNIGEAIQIDEEIQIDEAIIIILMAAIQRKWGVIPVQIRMTVGRK